MNKKNSYSGIYFPTDDYKRTPSFGKLFLRLGYFSSILFILSWVCALALIKVPVTSVFSPWLNSILRPLVVADAVSFQAMLALLALRAYFQARRSIDQLLAGRKKYKSLFILFGTLFGAFLGMSLGKQFMLLPPQALVKLAVIAPWVSAILTLAGVMAVADMFARVTGWIESQKAILLGVGAFGLYSLAQLYTTGIAFSALPLPIMAPLLVGVIGAHVCSYAAKQSARLYYYCRYGHTNADGYYFEVDKSFSSSKKDFDQAAVFGKTSAETRDLRVASLNMIDHIKKNTRFRVENKEKRSVKDVFQALHLANDRQDVNAFSMLAKAAEEGLTYRTHNIKTISSSFFGGLQFKYFGHYTDKRLDQHVQANTASTFLFNKKNESIMQEYEIALKPF